MRTKRFGFTLAEVLITLGIIGVVAAMTIPTLISNTNSAKFKSQYKKTLSTLNQAALMATAQYDLDYASITGSGTCNASSKPDEVANVCALFNGSLSGISYLGKLTTIKVASNASGKGEDAGYKPTLTSKLATTNMEAIQLADGSMVVYNPKMAGCTLGVGGDVTALAAQGTPATEGKEAVAGSSCYGFIDVNGTTLPNKEVTCSTAKSTTVSSTVGDCVVRNNATDMGDVFPVVFHDGTVEPITNAARYVLNQSK